MSQLSKDQASILFIIMGVMAALTVLIDIGIFIAWAVRKDDVDRGLKPPLFAPRWSLVDVWIGGQIVMAILIGVMTVGMVIGLFSGAMKGGLGGADQIMSNPVMLLLIMIAQNGLLILVPVLFITQKYRVSMADIGWPLLPSAKIIGMGIGFGILMMVASNVFSSSLMWMISHLMGPDIQKKLEEWTNALTVEGMIHGKLSWSLYLTLLFSAGFAAPIGEEVFFRGFLYNCAKRRFGVWPGILLSSVVFAMIHGGPIAVVAIVPLGIALAYAYEKSGSLWMTIVMHALNNSVAITFLFLHSRLTN